MSKRIELFGWQKNCCKLFVFLCFSLTPLQHLVSKPTFYTKVMKSDVQISSRMQFLKTGNAHFKTGICEGAEFSTVGAEGFVVKQLNAADFSEFIFLPWTNIEAVQNDMFLRLVGYVCGGSSGNKKWVELVEKLFFWSFNCFLHPTW